jgi:hypothetical protein
MGIWYLVFVFCRRSDDTIRNLGKRAVNAAAKANVELKWI